MSDAAAPPPANLRLRSEGLAVEVSPRGAELQRIATPDGPDLQWDGDPAWWTGRAPVLFPVIGMLHDGEYRLDGRTYRLPKHGFARHADFQVVESGEEAALLRLEADEATRAVYPFDFRLDVRVSVAGAALTLAAEVSNRGDRPMPASLGFHPALRWPLPFGEARAAHRVEFAEDEPAPVRRIDGDGLLIPAAQPTPIEGRTLAPEDRMFEADALIFDGVRSRRVVYGAPGAPRLAVEFDGFPVLGVWTKPGAPFLCIEPWAGLPDPEGYEGDLYAKPGMWTVQPGEMRRHAIRIALLPAED